MSDALTAGRLLSVNAAQPHPLQIGGKTVRTGIDKRPVAGAVWVGRLGVTGDHVLNRKHHGGPDQAVYAYWAEDYAFWQEALGRPVLPGQFGENLTVSGAESANVRVGDRLEVGGALLEVTAPRIPCATFAAHLGEPAFVKRFADAGRPGAYLRVIAEGEVEAGDPVRLLPGPAGAPTLGELFRLWYDRSPDPLVLQSALHAPLGVRLRAELERRLAARQE